MEIIRKILNQQPLHNVELSMVIKRKLQSFAVCPHKKTEEYPYISYFLVESKY